MRWPASKGFILWRSLLEARTRRSRRTVASFALTLLPLLILFKEFVGSMTSFQLLVSIEANINIVVVDVRMLGWFVPATSWIVELLWTRQSVSFMISKCVLAITLIFMVSIVVIVVVKIFVLAMLIMIVFLNLVVLVRSVVLLMVWWWWRGSIRTRTNTSMISAVVWSRSWPLLKERAVSIHQS